MGDEYDKALQAAWEKYRITRKLDPTQRRYTTPHLIAQRFRYFGDSCWICKAADVKLEKDHVKPISAGGAHWPCNLRPICVRCNRRKAAVWPHPLINLPSQSP